MQKVAKKMASKTEQVKVTLIKSVIGRTQKQIANVRGLGLRKIGSSKVLTRTACVEGMIGKVHFLLNVEDV